MQLSHNDHSPSGRKFEMVLICDSIQNAANVGGLFRLADAFGIEQLFFIGKDTPMGRKMKKASRSTEQYVEHKLVEFGAELIVSLKKKGFSICALEITDNSESLNSFKFPIHKKLAILVGGEIDGVSNQMLSLADSVIHIDMFGQNSSMNVVSSASIVLYEATKQYKSCD